MTLSIELNLIGIVLNHFSQFELGLEKSRNLNFQVFIMDELIEDFC